VIASNAVYGVWPPPSLELPANRCHNLDPVCSFARDSRRRLFGVISDALEDHRSTPGNLWLSKGYTAYLLSRGVRDDDAVDIFLTGRLDVIENNPSYWALAQKPLLTHMSMLHSSLEARQVIVASVFEEEEYYTGQAPYDDYAEIENLRWKYRGFVSKCAETESDPFLKDLLSRFTWDGDDFPHGLPK
jgi:hypothetical protein